MSDHLPINLSFAVGGTIDIAEDNSNIKLVYKNNTKELFFSSNYEINKLNLMVVDINGKIVQTGSSVNIQEINWSLKSLPVGFYIARLKINNTIKNLKFVIN